MARRRGVLWAIVLICLVVITFSLARHWLNQSTITSADLTPTIALVASGFSAPLCVTGAVDGSADLYVVEQAGRIRHIQDGTVLPKPFLDISGLVTARSERGLLSLALHLDYADNGRLYVYYTDNTPDHALTIAENTHTVIKDVSWT